MVCGSSWSWAAVQVVQVLWTAQCGTAAAHSVELAANGQARTHRPHQLDQDLLLQPYLRREHERRLRQEDAGVMTEQEVTAFRDVNETKDVEVEEGAIDTATEVVNEISANATPVAEVSAEAPLDQVANATGKLGPAGRPALVFAGMYGEAGVMGPRGPTGPAGGVGPRGPAGASVVGPAGIQGTPGTAGKAGKTGAVGAAGLPGQAGTPGEPPHELEHWTKLLDYYTESIYRMESAASTHIRGFKREASMLQQRSALFNARTQHLDNKSEELHQYMVDNYKRMVKSVSSAREVDGFVQEMPTETSLSALHEAQRLYPAYLGTQRVATAMQAAAIQRQQPQYASQPHYASRMAPPTATATRRESKSGAAPPCSGSLLFVLLALVCMNANA
mmetsp:Transcript_30663/g.57373  ORF Transcript_30663/g.57373 Transcript_30663/m.57373 type:complete len:390 (-) Transcript_30663:121-1290(-)